MKNHLLYILLLFTSYSIGFASQNEGGEITYACLGNNQFLIIEKPYHDSLPINLISFQVEVKEKSVFITWNTSSRVEGVFYIERSVSGTDFEVISQEINTNNGNVISNYCFTDHDPIPGISYYRLIVFDEEGNFKISKSFSVNREKYPEYAVTPNPACDYIDIKSNVDMTALVSVVDILGSPILTTHAYGDFAKIEIGLLPAGMYTVLINQNNFIIRKKILITR
jgi:hypothetical protein